MIKLQCKTPFNSVFVGKKIIKIEQENKETVKYNQTTFTATCQKYPVTVIFYYIFHEKPHFLKTLFQSRLLFDFDDFFTFLFDFDEMFTNRSKNVRSFL
jgi:hypothetical protein